MKKILMFTGLIMLLLTLNATAQQDKLAIKKGMIKVTILYPSGENKKFDMDYYLSKHIPLVKSLFAGDLRWTAIDKGIAGGAPGAPAPYMLICYLYFDTVSAFQNAMKANGSKIQADIPNFTNIHPVIQISEVVQ